MSLIPRPEGARGLMDEPVFTRNLLKRLHAHHEFGTEQGVSTLDVEVEGDLPEGILDGAFVICVLGAKIKVARVKTVGRRDERYRLFLHPWKRFEDNPGEGQPLSDGITIWIGAVDRHL